MRDFGISFEEGLLLKGNAGLMGSAGRNEKCFGAGAHSYDTQQLQI